MTRNLGPTAKLAGFGGQKFTKSDPFFQKVSAFLQKVGVFWRFLKWPFPGLRGKIRSREQGVRSQEKDKEQEISDRIIRSQERGVRSQKAEGAKTGTAD